MISLVMTTFQRSKLLEFGLKSILRQGIKDLEIIVVNDGMEDSTAEICAKYKVKYLFTGQRNFPKLLWRCPGFALNIGVKQAQGDILILSCAEIYHIGSCIPMLLQPLHDTAICIPEGKDDSGEYLQYISVTGFHSDEIYDMLPKLNTKLPFLMAMKKSIYYDVGGYDEDFTGQAFDDTDFVTRLTDFGCEYITTPAKCVHLYHSRNSPDRNVTRWQYNKELFEARRGIIIRNIGRTWGEYR